MSSLAALFAMLALIGIAYQAATLLTARRMMRSVESAAPGGPHVAVLRPLHGDEPGLVAALASAIAQDYAGPVTHVFGVADAADPAIAIVEGLRRAYPAADIRLVIDPAQHGTNRKISNLLNMMREANGEIIILADSDILVGRDYLTRLVAMLAEPGIGAVSCLYRGRAVVPGLWARLSALAIDAHFLPNAALGIAFGLATPCFGSTIALRRDTLVAAGGLEAVKDQLADDYALGAAVRALGLKVAFPDFLVDHNCVHETARALLSHDLRWARTIRQVDPAGHFGTLVTFALPNALLAAIFGGFSPAGLAGLSLVLAWRIAQFRMLAQRFGLARDRIWLLPFRDMLSYAMLIASFLGRGVAWRGTRFDVGASGAMTPSLSRPASTTGGRRPDTAPPPQRTRTDQ